MSWIDKLYRTYENNTDAIGSQNDKVPLLPICHTTQKAHITISIDNNGKFLRASVVPKSEARTIIPATEESAGRTSGTTPHPLCDKLQYIAADYDNYGGEKDACYEMYISLIGKWVNADSKQEKIKAVLAYVSKGNVVADLVAAAILHVDCLSMKLINQWTGKDNSPEIFKLLPGGFDNKGKYKPWQADAFVRWSVETPGDPQPEVWLDKRLWQSWEDYYGSLKSTKGICYVTGEGIVLAEQHPAKIRNDGDKAKLISSNDSSGFTFRGRFISADEVCGVGFSVTQKAHSALRWLIARQGRRDGDQAVVAWAVSGADVPDPQADTFSLLFGDDQNTPLPKTGYTAKEVGLALSNKIAGYATKLKTTNDVVVMGLDSATPGRMAITYYRELTGAELLARVQAWHEGCSWHQRFSKEKVFVGAPAPRDIAEVAYGRKLDEKLRKATVERLLPCIIDGVPVPLDLVQSCTRRASNKNGIEDWEWEKALGIACALFRYRNKERNYSMALERERKERDYLYGRLLALAEHLEGRALHISGETRETNAAKLMQRFADRPYSTWRIIETSLTPYKVRLRAKRPGFLQEREKEIDEIMKSFSTEDFLSDRKLEGEFLLAYHCQRAALWGEQTAIAVDSEEDIEE